MVVDGDDSSGLVKRNHAVMMTVAVVLVKRSVKSNI
jgi:hypothetical protein